MLIVLNKTLTVYMVEMLLGIIFFFEHKYSTNDGFWFTLVIYVDI